MRDNKETAITASSRSKDFAFISAGLAMLLISYSYYQKNEAYIKQLQVKATLEEKHDYQIVQLGTFRRDQFMIDKETGRVWSNVCIASGSTGVDCAQNVWDEQSVVGLNGYTQQDLQNYIKYYNEATKSKDKTSK